MNKKNSMVTMVVLFLFIAGVLFVGLSGKGGRSDLPVGLGEASADLAEQTLLADIDAHFLADHQGFGAGCLDVEGSFSEAPGFGLPGDQIASDALSDLVAFGTRHGLDEVDRELAPAIDSLGDDDGASVQCPEDEVLDDDHAENDDKADENDCPN